jgi:hypothetical protein
MALKFDSIDWQAPHQERKQSMTASFLFSGEIISWNCSTLVMSKITYLTALGGILN